MWLRTIEITRWQGQTHAITALNGVCGAQSTFDFAQHTCYGSHTMAWQLRGTDRSMVPPLHQASSL